MASLADSSKLVAARRRAYTIRRRQGRDSAVRLAQYAALGLPYIAKQRVISNGPRRLFTAHSRLAVESAKIPIPVAAEQAR